MIYEHYIEWTVKSKTRQEGVVSKWLKHVPFLVKERRNRIVISCQEGDQLHDTMKSILQNLRELAVQNDEQCVKLVIDNSVPIGTVFEAEVPVE